MCLRSSAMAVSISRNWDRSWSASYPSTAARHIEQRVAKQLIGTRVSVTMGDLRSIRVFVLGEAEKPARTP